MYAVIRTGGKQYKVSPGQALNVDKLELAVGSEHQLKDVLLVGGGEKTAVGTPLVAGATVSVVVTEQLRGKKILIVKKKRRHKYRRLNGHRSYLTRLFVKAISFGGQTETTEVKPVILMPDRVKKARPTREASEGAEQSATKATAKKAAPKKAAGGKKQKSGAAKKKARIQKIKAKKK